MKAGGGDGGGTDAFDGAGGEGGDDDDSLPALATMTIDRVVEQLFFVRISVYNAKGKLSEPQQVSFLQGATICRGITRVRGRRTAD